MLFETQRTYVRPFTPGDVAAVLKLNSNAEVTLYTGDANEVQTPEDARAVIREVWLKEYAAYGYGRWAVVHKKDNQVIGFAGFKFLPEVGMPDIGYRLLPQYWGQGLATEVVLACAQYGRNTLGIKEYFGDVMADNHASVRLLQKLGLTFNRYVEYDGYRFMRFA